MGFDIEWILVAGNVMALVWGASRVSTTVARLDKTLDKLADAVATETETNAVQNERLSSHEKRLDVLERYGVTRS
jgi:hypothetical protein